MASVQEAGLVRLYRQTPSGNRTLIAQDRVESFAPSGGAPEGAGASIVTPDQQARIDSNVTLVNDDKLIVTFEPDTGGDGIDASDCVWRIPLVTPQGSKSLGQAQFQNPALSDLTLIANEQDVAGYKIVEGSARLSGRIYLDIQDDTA